MTGCILKISEAKSRRHAIKGPARALAALYRKCLRALKSSKYDLAITKSRKIAYELSFTLAVVLRFFFAFAGRVRALDSLPLPKSRDLRASDEKCASPRKQTSAGNNEDSGTTGRERKREKERER